jgi:Response regulators consisting of a CheY-like receiver domain and a winged-helix DNA-binding domain
MTKKHILVVDDEKEITDLIEIYLTTENYRVTKRYDASTIEQDIEGVDLVILDIMMPNINGLAACQMIREKANVPIIMLSAKSSDADKIIGLNLGADDYMTKPFNPLELVARVKSQLRRFTTLNPNPQTATDLILIRDLCIDQKKHIVSIRGENATLTPIEFEILVLLCSHPNIVFSMEEIFEKVWKERYYDSNNTVMVHIRKLREKIEKNPRYPEYIKTVWGVGYKVEN